MKTRVHCPSCQQFYDVDPQLMCRKLRCQVCKTVFEPAESTAAGPAPASGPVASESDLLSPLDEETAAEQFQRVKLGSRSDKRRNWEEAQRRRQKKIGDEEVNSGLMNVGIGAMIFSIGSMVLPLFGLQFVRFHRMGEFAPFFGCFLGFIGAILLAGAYGWVRPKAIIVAGASFAGVVLTLIATLAIGPAFNNPDQPTAEEIAQAEREMNRDSKLRPKNRRQPAARSSDQPADPPAPEIDGIALFKSTAMETDSALARPADVIDNQIDRQQPTESAYSKQELGDVSNQLATEIREKYTSHLDHAFPKRYLTPMVGEYSGRNVFLFDPDKRPVIGLCFAGRKRFAQYALSELVPIFEDGDIKPDTIARPGYVLGGLNVHAQDHVIGIQPIYMRLTGSTVDPSDQYTGRWLGEAPPKNGYRTVKTKNSEAVIGVRLLKTIDIAAVGLIFERNNNQDRPHN